MEPEMMTVMQELRAATKDRLDELEKKVNRIAIGGGGGAPSPTGEEMKAIDAYLRRGETKAMLVGNDPAGGYLAPYEFADAITVVGAEQGAIRPLARVYTPGTADFKIPTSPTLAAASWTGETGTRANTATPTLAMATPSGGGIYAVAPVSNWLLNDAKYDVAQFVVESVGQQFGVTESAAFVGGTGVNQPQGFNSYTYVQTGDATRTWGQIEDMKAGSTTAITIDNIISLLGKLAPRYRKNAAFVMHPDTQVYVRQLKASTSGDYYWQPSTQAGMPDTLLGLPCFIDVNMPTIASAAHTITVADWRKFYAIADIGPTLMIRDNVTSKGNTLFYTERRVGGVVVDFNAGKSLIMST